MSISKNFGYRAFVYSFIVSYLVINHTFPKICIILESFLDNRLGLPHGLNIMTVGSSTAMSAIGKFLGILIEGSKKKIIILTFVFNALCLFLCIYTKNVILFIFARSFQGFFAGIQLSILFGLIGTLPDCKSGFRNFTTISSIVCFLTGVFLFFFDPIHMIIGLIFINIFSVIFFVQVMPFTDKSFSLKSIDWNILGRLTVNRRFFLKTAFLGVFLGCSMLAISQQKHTIMDTFNIKFHCISNTLSSITFLASGFISFFSVFHSTYLFNLLNFICLWCVFLGLATKSLYIFLAGIFLPFCCFAIINPMVMEEVTLLSSNRFISSAYGACFRSIVTSIIICIIPLLIPKDSILEVAIMICFISGLFYTFIYGKHNH